MSLSKTRNQTWRVSRLLTALLIWAMGLTIWTSTRLSSLSNDDVHAVSSGGVDDGGDQYYPHDEDEECPEDAHYYKGILWIQQGDREGAAGTIFYLFVLNQLLYAERHHLYPWIHMSDASPYVYDDAVHGNNASSSSTKMIVTAPDWDPALLPAAGLVGDCPAAPPVGDVTRFRLRRVALRGNGVWASYFASFHEIPRCLRAKPVVRLTADQILRGLHLRCPWSVRAWRYGGAAPAVRKHTLSLREWWRPQRHVAAGVVRRYYEWRPALRDAVDAVTAPFRNDDDDTTGVPVVALGLHIRHSDKANGRRRLNVTDDVRPFLEAYWRRVPDGHVYLATDSDAVVSEIRRLAGPRQRGRVHVQPHVMRSSNASAVFHLTTRHDVTNRQVLIDIGALSRCTFLLHGLSAVSEAAIYHNIALHERSFNLEDARHPPRVADWERLLQNYFMSEKGK